MGVGGCPAVVAQWQSTGGSSQRCPGFDFGLFTFLYFCFITSKSMVVEDICDWGGGANDLCACISTHMLGWSRGMLPQENFAN